MKAWLDRHRASWARPYAKLQALAGNAPGWALFSAVFGLVALIAFLSLEVLSGPARAAWRGTQGENAIIVAGVLVWVGVVGVLITGMGKARPKSGSTDAISKLLAEVEESQQVSAAHQLPRSAKVEQKAKKAKPVRPPKPVKPAARKGPSVGAQALKIARVWLDQQNERSARLADLRREFGPWPKVALDGRGYVLAATHASPRYAKSPKTAAYVTAFAVFLVYLNNTNNFGGSIIFGMIAGCGSYPLWHVFFRVRLTITVQNGGAKWTGPNGKTCRIGPDENYEATSIAHRGAKEEAIKHIEILRKKPNAKPVAVYQLASEAVLRTGLRKQIEWPVAEIAKDPTGRLATALSSALDIAIEKNRGEVAEVKAAARAGQMGRRASLDDE